MSNEMDSMRLAEVLEEYEGYNHDIKLGEVYGTMMLGEFVWMLGRIAELEEWSEAAVTEIAQMAVESGQLKRRIAKLEAVIRDAPLSNEMDSI